MSASEPVRATKSPTVRCPGCGEDVVLVPVLYGYPKPEGFEAAERGELVIGGCEIGFGPDAVCPICGEGFDAPSMPEVDDGEGAMP